MLTSSSSNPLFPYIKAFSRSKQLWLLAQFLTLPPLPTISPSSQSESDSDAELSSSLNSSNAILMPVTSNRMRLSCLFFSGSKSLSTFKVSFSLSKSWSLSSLALAFLLSSSSCLSEITYLWLYFRACLWRERKLFLCNMRVMRFISSMC